MAVFPRKVAYIPSSFESPRLHQVMALSKRGVTKPLYSGKHTIHPSALRCPNLFFISWYHLACPCRLRSRGHTKAIRRKTNPKSVPRSRHPNQFLCSKRGVQLLWLEFGVNTSTTSTARENGENRKVDHRC